MFQSSEYLFLPFRGRHINSYRTNNCNGKPIFRCTEAYNRTQSLAPLPGSFTSVLVWVVTNKQTALHNLDYMDIGHENTLPIIILTV